MPPESAKEPSFRIEVLTPQDTSNPLIQEYLELRAKVFTTFFGKTPYDKADAHDQAANTRFILAIDNKSGKVVGGKRIMIHEPGDTDLSVTSKWPELNRQLTHFPGMKFVEHSGMLSDPPNKDILDTLTLKALEIAKTENADVFLGVGISKTQKNALSKGAIPYFFNLCSGQNIDCHVMGNAVAMDPSNEQGAVGYLVVNPLSPQARGNIYASIALEEQIAFLEISRQASQLPESKKVNDCIKDLLDFYVEIRRGAIDTTAKTLERMKQNGISANNPYIVYGSFPKAMLALEERTHSTLLSREQREELNTLNNEVLKAIENLVKRLIDEQEQKNDTRIATIRAYGESLNPGKNLHEVLEHNLMANKLNSMIPAGAAHGR